MKSHFSQELPSAHQSKHPIYHQSIDTPLGTMYATATAEGICGLAFMDGEEPNAESSVFTSRFGVPVQSGTHVHLERLEKELDEYFQALRKSFTVPVVMLGTTFQRAVWHSLSGIPYGATLTYGQQAVRLGNPRAVRAVARANAMNRIAIVVPCHRVLGSRGVLTGYAGGLHRKKYLLRLEEEASDRRSSSSCGMPDLFAG